jgi:hypothetical protein
MERPKDDHKLTHNVRLQRRDTLFGGTVSRLQVAELIAAAVASPELAQNKAVEVVAEVAAPRAEYEELLAGQAAEVTQEAREAAMAEAAEVRAQLGGAAEEVSWRVLRPVWWRARGAQVDARSLHGARFGSLGESS